MLCNNCNKENRTESKFCRFCGTKLVQVETRTIKLHIPAIHIPIPTLASVVVFVRRQNRKVLAIILITIILGGGTAFAAPKINDYIKVNKVLTQVSELESSGNYKEALDALVSTDGKWTFQSKRQEIEKYKGAEAKYIKFKESFNSALEKERAGKFTASRELLQTIDTTFPEYGKVKEKLDNLQIAIEGNLKVQAQKASAAAAEAQHRADEESAAKTRAQAEQAASEAQARAAAQAARDAEIQRQQAEARRQQEEQQKLEERRISFLNQLFSIYNAANRDGRSYYNNAMSYYNNGSELAALAGFGQAQAIFVNAYNNALSLKNAFSGGMSSTYLAAVNNMMYATDNYDNAVKSITNHIASGSYGTSNANYYSNNGDTYMSNVRSFLISQGY